MSVHPPSAVFGGKFTQKYVALFHHTSVFPPSLS